MDSREASKTSPIVSWQALVLLAAIASNLFWATPLLRSSRPSTKTSAERALGKQDVDARLWQDPFQAIAAQVKNPGTVSNEGPHSIGQLAAQIRSRGSLRVTILPVMVTGAPYAEDSEWRLRSRYAVISGLTVSNYSPEDSQHIGFIRLPWPNDASREPDAEFDPVLVVPYEWYNWSDFHTPYPPSDKNAADYVLVLWLRDELFSDRPLYRLASLLERLNPPSDSTNNMPLVTVTVLGPYGSTTLNAMIQEAKQSPEIREKIFNTLSPLQTRMYSPSATAADAFLMGHFETFRDRAKTTPRTIIRQSLECFGVQLINCSCTDDQLTGALIDELARRNVALTNEHEGVVMISEEDTFYGCALPATFNLQLKEIRPCNEAAPHEWAVRHYTYMRGLDGKAASNDAAAEKGPVEKKPETGSGRPEWLERPENSSQLDYVRRLVARIAEDCSGREFHERHSGERPQALKAIGVVGSDVYDKLLLLQSLRKAFPDVIFFTTDLDARLFHPQELKSTRNLLVASSFGLELAPEYQNGIPPFRDTYQTALFLAARAGLGSVPQEMLGTNLSPRLFEIGQLGAVDISVDEPPLHPRRENYGSVADMARLGWVVWLVPIFGAISICQVLPASRRFKWGGKKRKRVAWVMAFIGALGITLFLRSLVKDYGDPRGEPVLFLSGVSIWPTEIIRCITACFAFWWLLVAAQKLEQDKALLADFGFSDSGDVPSQKRGFRDRFKVARWKAKDANGNPIEPPVARARSLTGLFEPAVSADLLWKDYFFLGTPVNRAWRVALASTVYMVFAICVISLDPPFVPGRGRLSFLVDRITMMVLVIGFVVLMFVVVDATRLCTRMVRHLADCTTQWGDKAYSNFQNVHLIPKAYLSDWMDIRFTAARTRTVVRLIYYPFIIIFLMIISRSHFFDGWDWPWGIRIVVGLNAAYAFFCAAALRLTAEYARRMALDRMRAKLALVRAGKIEVDDPAEQTAEGAKAPVEKGDKTEPARDRNGILVGRKEIEAELKELIDEVKGIEDGAFAPWSRQPLVGALVMPFTGAGLLAVLQYLATRY